MWKYVSNAPQMNGYINDIMGRVITCGVGKCIYNDEYKELIIGKYYIFVANKNGSIDILTGGISGRKYPATCILLVSWSTKDGYVGRNGILYDEYRR